MIKQHLSKFWGYFFSMAKQQTSLARKFAVLMKKKRVCSKNTIHDVNPTNIFHFHQQRGYSEDFMNKSSLYRTDSEVKLRLFSPFWQVDPTFAYSFVPRPPISVKYVSKKTAWDKYIAIKMPGIHRNLWKQLNYPNFDDLFRIFASKILLYQGQMIKIFEIGINWSIMCF